MNLQIGNKAPDFTLYNSDKIKVSLSEYKGKNVVLLFFPLAFSSVCTAELCNVRDNLAVYNQANAEVFGISVDSVYVLKKYKEDLGINFTLLSDFNKNVSEEYDSLYETFGLEMRGVSKRSAFVINKDGEIVYKEICASPGDQPDYNAILSVLNTLH